MFVYQFLAKPARLCTIVRPTCNFVELLSRDKSTTKFVRSTGLVYRAVYCHPVFFRTQLGSADHSAFIYLDQLGKRTEYDFFSLQLRVYK